MATNIVLYGLKGSPFVRKVQIFMAEKGAVDTARKTLQEKLPRLFDYLEKSIDDREFLAGDAFSIGDIGVATQFVNFDHSGGRVDATRWPRLAEYVTRMHARPSIAACLEEERKMMPTSDIEL